MSDVLEENLEQQTQDEVDIELLNSLKEKLEEQKAEVNDAEDRYKRLMAEFDNFKKRSSKEREGLYSSIIADIAVSLLPVIDNLEKAVQVKTEDNNYKIGVELVLKQFNDVLATNGIKAIEAVGKPFDPELHEAVGAVEDSKLGSQIVKEEYRKGYMIGNKVIRHSLVVVAN